MYKPGKARHYLWIILYHTYTHTHTHTHMHTHMHTHTYAHTRTASAVVVSQQWPFCHIGRISAFISAPHLILSASST